MGYKAFISYRHSENGRRHAVALETALKRYAKPTLARPMKIFRDEKHMKPDISLPKLIRDGLENSEYLIFLAERASAESQWCGEELEYWCGTLRRTDRLIIALIADDIALDGTNSIHWAETTALPALLRPHLPSIPLYMDVRWAKTPADTDLQNPRYRHEINALAARLRVVNPEDLNDEEIRVFRRNIRLRNGAIGVLLGMLVVALGATFWAIQKQKEATIEKERAVAALKKLQIETAPETKIFFEEITKWEEANGFLPNDSTWRAMLDSLSLSWMGLMSVSEQIFECKKLTTLILYRNEVNIMPSQIGKLSNLKRLEMPSNQLVALPPEIGNLKKLEKLNLSYNQLALLPPEIGGLIKLKQLILSKNLLTTLPRELVKLENLEQLDLSSNQLKGLPPGIKKLKKLTTLVMDGNKLTNFPNELNELESLNILSLNGNEIKSLPKEITNLKNLTNLFLVGNPIPPSELDKIEKILPNCKINFDK